ncbi:MAG: glucose-6-phosphate isomerase family protein [Bacillota bacterium]
MEDAVEHTDMVIPLDACGLPLMMGCVRAVEGEKGDGARHHGSWQLFVRDGGLSTRRLEPSQVRTVGDLHDVLPEEDKPLCESSNVAYWMYREVCSEEHRDLLRRHRLRFDVTVLDAIMLGSQFNKTYGHYHAEALPGMTYPEVYQVIYGRALYLLQRPERDRPDVVEDFIAVMAAPGDVVVVPPGYGHVTVNVGNGPLVMANLVEMSFLSHYGPFRTLAGAAYYARVSMEARVAPFVLDECALTAIPSRPELAEAEIAAAEAQGSILTQGPSLVPTLSNTNLIGTGNPRTSHTGAASDTDGQIGSTHVATHGTPIPVRLIKNGNYTYVPKPRHLSPVELAYESGVVQLFDRLFDGLFPCHGWFGNDGKQSLYRWCCSNPELFSFLVIPNVLQSS